MGGIRKFTGAALFGEVPPAASLLLPTVTVSCCFYLVLWLLFVNRLLVGPGLPGCFLSF